MTDLTLDGTSGRLAVHCWEAAEPRFIVLLAHGFGEHARRYDHVAERLVAAGAAVYAPDHHGHGRSDGERALVDDVEARVVDMHRVADQARSEHPGLPLVLIGHSMGGLLGTLFIQRYGTELAGAVLSAPVIGGNPDIEALLTMDPIPEIPIDPAALSRDPAVGEAYAADELVYHGPFQRATLEAFFGAVGVIAAGPGFGELPVLWIHGTDDPLAPLAATRPAIETLRGPRTSERIYDGARHEVFNETNKDDVLDDVVAFIAELT